MKEFKNYIIGFIVGILSVGTITYAAGNGSIGELFELVGTQWKLNGDNIKDNSIGDFKIISDTISSGSLAKDSVGNSELIDSPVFTNPTVSTPIAATHVANKDYVDTAVAGGGGVSVINDLSDAKTIGTHSVFIGEGAGISSEGFVNTAVGGNSLYSNITGWGNVANGYQSLYSNTTGEKNVANGYQSLYLNTTGWENVANGSFSLYKNINGRGNVGIGSNTLMMNTVGNSNVAIGGASLYANTTGWGNTAIGVASSRFNETGNTNTSIGMQSLRTNVTGTGNIALGHRAGFYETGSNKLYIDNSDTTSPLIKGDFAANTITINGTLTQTSDERLKKDIRSLDSSLEKIKSLRGVDFAWKDTGKEDIGLIAQEVEKVFPEVVETSESSGYKSVAYSKMVGPIIEAIKELSNKIDELFEKYLSQEKDINTLKEKNNILFEKIELLENNFSQNN